MEDGEIKYRLPFDNEQHPVRILQGHNGPWSHQGLSPTKDSTFAVDFLLPLGTKVLAMRDGRLHGAFDTSDACYEGTDPEVGNQLVWGDTNYAVIEHDDGTHAWYSHLEKGSVRVVRGEAVSQGQVIARTGRSGWLGPEPHVHVQVNERFDSLPIRFKDYDGPLEHVELVGEEVGHGR
jgi:murein DD-endopeptidase MepM/ murein hydrolase activator NlpD